MYVYCQVYRSSHPPSETIMSDVSCSFPGPGLVTGHQAEEDPGVSAVVAEPKRRRVSDVRVWREWY